MMAVNNHKEIEEKISELGITSTNNTNSSLIEGNLDNAAQNSSQVDGKSEGEINGQNIKLPPGYSFSTSQENDEAYNMNHNQRGHCVVFNHREFDHHLNLGERNGTDRDRNQVVSLFKLFEFEVAVYNDSTTKEIEKALVKYAYDIDHSDFDCFVMVFMSHGESGLLYGRNEPFKSEKLFNHFTADNCPSLAGKPKMFFIQACRGDKLDSGSKIVTKDSRDQTDSGSYSMYTIPNHADFLTCWSTVPGGFDVSNCIKNERSLSRCSVVSTNTSPSFEKGVESDVETSSVECACGILASADALDEESQSPCMTCEGHYSWRNTTNGSWFIQSLVKVFSQYSNTTDVLSMMTVVNRYMIISFESNCPSNKGMHGKKQSASSVSTLMRQVYLRPKQ